MANLTDKNEEKRDSPTLYSENTCPNSPPLHLPMNERISIQEVGTAVKRHKNGKSPGDDSITNNMMKAASTDMIQLLHLLYSSLWRWTSTPTQWRAALIKPIYKRKKKDKQDPASYRGIALSSSLTDFFLEYSKCWTHNIKT